MTLPFGELLLRPPVGSFLSFSAVRDDLRGSLAQLVYCQAPRKSISDPRRLLSPVLVNTLCTCRSTCSPTRARTRSRIQFKDVSDLRRHLFLLDISQAKPQTDYQSARVAQGNWDWTFRSRLER